MTSVRVAIAATLIVGFAVAVAPQSATASSIKVNPGESIQAAVDAANPGDTVIVYPGDYTETHGGTAAVKVTKSIKLIGKSKLKSDPPVKVRILPGPGNQHGILVEPANGTGPDVEKVMIKGFTVEGFSNNGIWLRHVNNFKIIGNESIDNLENGIWPTLSAKGLVKKNVSYGSEDAALWVEAAEDVRVIKNELYDAPTGLEITVSKDILVKKNDIHDNTVGVGLYHPNAASLNPLGGDGFWRIEKNDIHDNNAPNTAPGGSLSSALPSGAGILLLGVDDITIKGNNISNNEFLGVGLIDWCLAVGLAGPGSGIDCGANPPVVEPAPDRNTVIQNTFTNNGGNPPSEFAFASADIVFLLAAGQDNCASDNLPTSASTVPSTGLPACN